MDEEILKTLENIEKILKSSSLFGSRGLGDSASRARDAIKNRLKKSDDKTFKAVTDSVKDLDGATAVLTVGFKGLNVEVGKTTSMFGALNSQVARLVSTLQPITPATEQEQGSQRPIIGQVPIKELIERLKSNFLNLGGAISFLGLSMDQLGEVVTRVTKDYFALAQVGMGSVDSLATLYKNALLSGMSLSEYTAVLKENTAVAARAGSLEEFDAITSAATSQLAVLGVFGAEAKALQATLANSATLMGVSQDKLSTTISNQISVFEKLRKTTNMTVDEFGALVKSVTESDQAQRELIGLAPEERNARIQQLMQLASVGRSLGLSAEASKKLTDAMLAQRAETVKSRFEAAGRVRQLAAFAGMGDQGERAAQIIMRGRNATDAEREELRVIAGRLDAATQSIYMAGGLGAQNVIDILSEQLGSTAFGKLMEANRPAELAEQSAQIAVKNNKDFGQHVGAFGEFVGKLFTFGAGVIKSPLGGILGGIAGAILFTFRGPILGGLSKILSAGAASATTAMKPLSMLKGVLGGFGTAVSKLLPVFIKLAGPLAAIGEIITGKFRDALNPEGGVIAMIGGIVTSFLAAIPNLLLDAFSFIFGESLGDKIKNKFDIFLSYMNLAVKDLLAGILNLPKTVLGWLLPKDSGLVKMLDTARDALIDSATQNAAVVEQLMSDGSLTLDKLASKNREKNKTIAQEAEVSAAKVQQAQQAMISQPSVNVPKSVTPPAPVNTDNAQVRQEKISTLTTPELVTLLESILQVMQRSLAAEELQVQLAERSLEQNRPKASFTPTEELNFRLMKPRQGLV